MPAQKGHREERRAPIMQSSRRTVPNEILDPFSLEVSEHFFIRATELTGRDVQLQPRFGVDLRTLPLAANVADPGVRGEQGACRGASGGARNLSRDIFGRGLPPQDEIDRQPCPL